ncbi:apolipoprotein L2-like isoform X1 [Cervus canadensis]|uniref:apolipoprotein L2-like isoform X1 n=1 Tax=Cervus canadensis TaxID=1574408 RepID=UPI001CA32398|nr:apolipoprotein L2-like isoform X1 [Cervus canadensis]XP_043297588.1 apolipoprotein L2-like isoform X1 [Cervus canadensis]XP_043297589.1 apolipoprotein L2-like isoform X1 [Cervus canadensis]
MSSENLGKCSESENFFEDIVQYLQDTVSREQLELLLTEEEAWESFVAEADLSREETDALHEKLLELKTDLVEEDQHRPQQDQLDRKRFLEEFPRVKQELEDSIAKLHALADKVDKVHRDCTISSVVATSAGAVSGVLTILGLALAPVTAGISLGLSATGLGLGAAAAVTSVSTSIVEHVSRSSAETEASRLVPTDINEEGAFAEVLHKSTTQIVSSTKNLIQALQGIGKNVRAIKLAKVNPRLASHAKCFMTTGRVSIQRGKQVQRAFGGTALAMTKSARIVGAATAGVALLMDVALLVKEAKHLHEGAKTESAERMRHLAAELQKKLEELTWNYESLQEGWTWPLPGQCREQGHVRGQEKKVPS